MNSTQSGSILRNVILVTLDRYIIEQMSNIKMNQEHNLVFTLYSTDIKQTFKYNTLIIDFFKLFMK